MVLQFIIIRKASIYSKKEVYVDVSLSQIPIFIKEFDNI